MASLDDVVDLLRGCNRLLVFTGAGISTESGIPDFRGPDGLWTKVDPDDFTLGRYLSDPEVRKRAWQRRAFRGFLSALPNAGHFAVSRMWQAGLLIGCVTQNVDGLHQAAGLPEEAIAELHGSARTTSCTECRVHQPTEGLRSRIENGEEDPRCLACGGILKTDVVLFGEALPRRAMERAEAMAGAADAVLAVGTSLGVYPAAGIPLLVVDRGKPFVIVNRGPTELDPIADVVIDGPAGDTLQALADRLA